MKGLAEAFTVRIIKESIVIIILVLKYQCMKGLRIMERTKYREILAHKDIYVLFR